MSQITVTEAEAGQLILTGIGVLNDVILLSAPTPGSYRENLTLATDLPGFEKILLNLDLSTSHVSIDHNLMSEAGIPFENLTLKSIPTGCSALIDYTAPPTLAALSPDTAVSGDPDFVLSCTGTDLSPNTVINFGGEEEPTTHVSDTEVTTIVKPSLFAPAIVPVYLHVGDYVTEVLEFTFLEPTEE